MYTTLDTNKDTHTYTRIT